MLRQDELAFIGVLSNIELSSFFLLELRKAVAAEKALAASKANATSASPLSVIAELVVRL